MKGEVSTYPRPSIVKSYAEHFPTSIMVGLIADEGFDPLPSDLGSHLLANYDGQIEPGAILKVDCGCSIVVPPGFRAMIISSEFVFNGLFVPTMVMTTGRIVVPITNLSSEPIVITKGQLIAQITVEQAYKIQWRKI